MGTALPLSRVLPIMSMGGLLGRCPTLISLLPIAIKRVRLGRCPLFVRVLPVFITGRLPFTFFVSQVDLLILRPFLVDRHYAYCAPCKVKHKHVNFCMKAEICMSNCNVLKLRRQLSQLLYGSRNRSCMPVAHALLNFW